MPVIRLFGSGEVKVWLVGDNGEPFRQLGDPIGGLAGEVDWEATAKRCRLLGDEGLEIELVLREAPSAG